MGSRTLRSERVFFVQLKEATARGDWLAGHRKKAIEPGNPNPKPAPEFRNKKDSVTPELREAKKPRQDDKPVEVKEPRVMELSSLPVKAAPHRGKPLPSEVLLPEKAEKRGDNASTALTEMKGDTPDEQGVSVSAIYRGTAGTAGDTYNYRLIKKIRAAIQKATTYPPLARKRKIEGTVLAGFSINKSGIPVDIKILKTSGYGILDREVIRIIKRASPYPFLRERIEVPVSFRLVSLSSR